MKPFDWNRLLNEQRIPYAESGPNVKRGELAIQCPFCGSADPSKHMGLNLETGWWSCWRNRAQHSGKSPLRLIMRLLRVPYEKAREIAGLDDSYVDPEGFDAIAARVMGRDQTMAKPSNADRQALFLDSSFLEITDRIRTRRFWNYLYADRGFDSQFADVDRLVEKFDLRAGVRSVWTDRIIIPYYQDKKLVTWTGRAIAQSRIRYRDLEVDYSLLPPKETLFNHDAMYQRGRNKALILQEGPFDVMKIDFYGEPFGVRSVGLSTNSISQEQAFLLQGAVGHFDQIIVMLDTKSRLGVVDSMRMKQELNFIPDLRILSVPFGAGDGGNMTPAQVRTLCQEL